MFAPLSVALTPASLTFCRPHYFQRSAMNGFMSTTRRAQYTIALVAALAVPVLLHAQAQATTGVVRGTTMDSSGAPVVATIVL